MGERRRNRGTNVRIIDVEDLGEDAVVVDAHPLTLILIDPGLSCEDRIDILGQIMAEDSRAS